ncbi:hypothetical protein NW754_015217 [Fusarium falciforme]|nr:hypothetical protein NW754_015217 [Fusarium falciforme]
MHQISFSPCLLEGLAGQTAVITGSARGIGASTAALFNSHGANTVVVDLPSSRAAVEALVSSFPHPGKALFVPADVTVWQDLVSVFKTASQRFGRVDVLIANAGVMESAPVMDIEVDVNGDPIESAEALKVLDVNLKGTLNILRLGLHYLSKNPLSPVGLRGSIVCITSTSGYFGSTGNAAYISSKHGVVGLVRASLARAASLDIKLNAVAPATPQHTSPGVSASASPRLGSRPTPPEAVAVAIASLAADTATHGISCLVWGKYKRELELTQRETMKDWLGSDLVESFTAFGRLLESIGGFPLPQNGSQAIS